ncbi:hypothetical protein DYB32_000736, partial [Aphanomyces invadans]
ETAIDLGLTDDEFKADWHWVHSFKRRHGLSLRAKTRAGQDSNQDGTSTLADLCERVLICAMANDVDVIYNADQTAVNYEYLPSKTLNPTKDKTVWVKCGGKTKERATTMLLADTTGKKHPLFLVMKSTNGLDKRVILLWNDFSAHFTDDGIAYAESINVILLRNSKAANRNLKLVGPSRTTMVEWITGAWNAVPESVILNGFRKCQLIDGAVVEVVMPGDSLDVSDIADLMADSAVEETIDPAQDIDAIDAISSAEIVLL